MPYLISLVIGMVVGAVFGVAGASPPAPGDLRGILGVVGIWLGWLIATKVKTR